MVRDMRKNWMKLQKSPLSEKKSKELFSQVASMPEIEEKELKDYLNMPLKTYKDYKNSDFLIGIGSKIMYSLN